MQTASLTSECSEPEAVNLMRRDGRVSDNGKRGRRAPEPISRPVQRLIKIVQKESPAYVQRWLQDHVAEVLDEELEALAVWMLSGFDPAVDSDHVKILLAQGAFRRAANAIVMQARREFAAEIRRHQRRSIDKSAREE